MKWRTVLGERGAPVELHCFVEQRLAPVTMYRFRQGRWQERPGYGEPWKRCERPEDAPIELVLQLEEQAA